MALTRRFTLLALLLVALVGCGPSSAQLKEAREARYQGTRDEVFLAVSEAISKDYTIDRSDPDNAALITKGRWFEPDGTYEDKSEINRMEDGAIFLGFLLQVVGDAAPFQLKIEPSVDQIRTGYSALYHMKADDPQLPGWVKGKIDDLTITMHQRLKGKFLAPPSTPLAQ